MDDALEKRIEALERAITDGDHDLSALATDAEATERLTAVEAECEELADRVAELEAATQALRGYVGNIRSVNRDVEKRADAALARAESLESALDTPTGVDSQPEHDERDGSRPQANSYPATEESVPPDSSATVPRESTRDTENPGASAAHPRADFQKQTTETDHSASDTGTPESDFSTPTRRPETHTDRCCDACGQPTADSPTKIFPAGDMRADGGNVGEKSRGFDGRHDSTDTGPLDKSSRPPAHESSSASTDSSDGGTLQRIREML